MIEKERPDLNGTSPEVRAYIEALEAALERFQAARPRSAARAEPETAEPELPLEPSEPPTTMNLIVATAGGIAKRTARHLYTRQRRGGMGVFDIESPEKEPPAILAVADESDQLLLITDRARAFRMPVENLPETPLRARGKAIGPPLDLLPGEKLAAILPDRAEGYVALASRSGMVRLLRHHVFGEHMKPGTSLYDVKSFGPLAAACRTPGDGDLFIATHTGRAIRFAEKQVPPQGGQGIRLTGDDAVIAITPVYEDSGVFLLGNDGKGTIRLMEGFRANKAPGAGGKIALNTGRLVGAATVHTDDDIFIISRLSKIIRFQAEEVPDKEGVVQGVICISLRADEPAAMTVSPSPAALPGF